MVTWLLWGTLTDCIWIWSFYPFQIQNLVLTSSFDFWTSFFSLFFEAEAIELTLSFHRLTPLALQASRIHRRSFCRLGARILREIQHNFNTANLAIESKPICFYLYSCSFIFSFSFPLWHHLWDLYGFVWICGMSNVQILRWVMCGQSSLTTFARMALQEPGPSWYLNWGHALSYCINLRFAHGF